MFFCGLITVVQDCLICTSDLDQVTLSPDLLIWNQSIGVASTSKGLNDVDGILGIGPIGLTQGTVSDEYEIPTVTDNLYTQGAIGSETIGIYFEPTTTTGNHNGELSFGGVDQSKITGDVNYVPITQFPSANKYWGIDQIILYGEVPLPDLLAGIVDTGSTLILLDSAAYKVYAELTGGKKDESTGLLRITQEQYERLQPLNFIIGGITYALSPNASVSPV